MLVPNILVDGLVIGESPRWHQGRLWLCNWGAREVIAVDGMGNLEVMARVPTTIPFSIDWLPDGQLLVVCGSEGRLLRQEPDGALVDHADMRALGVSNLNEIVLDRRGHIYVNGGSTFEPLQGTAPGIIALVTPNGSVRRVADDIAFPERHGQLIARPLDPDHCRIVSRIVDGVRHCRRWQPVESSGLG